ncbi:MAG: UDP-N-acetylmuramoyl-tripeptide--D-alanyl-D-alanine ligase [bacterium]
MISLTLGQIAEITRGVCINGELRGRITGISIDSRSLKKNDLFIALKGENFDGHNFVETALKTCKAVLVEKPVKITVPGTVIKVHSTLEALQDIAAFRRTKISACVIAVTGSNGKTTVKDMITHILKKNFRVVSAEKSFNNFIGTPLTVLRADMKTEILVTEMETNVLGGTHLLCRITQPKMGVVTNIGNTHLEFLKSKHNVFREKSELLKYLDSSGTCFINNDDAAADKMKKNTSAKIVTFSIEKKSDFRAKILRQSLAGSFFSLHGKKLFLRVPGSFNVLNAAAAIAVVRQFGLGWSAIKEGLLSFRQQSGRTGVKKIKNRILLNDSFNANPDSVEVLCEIVMREKGKKCLVFGDMLELGGAAGRMHRKAGADFARAGVVKIFYFGRFGASFIAGAKKINGKIEAQVFRKKSKLINRIKKETARIYIFKGSRKMKIEEVFNGVVKHLSSRNR